MDTTFQSLQRIKPVNIDVTDMGKNLILTQLNNIRSNLQLLESDTSTAPKKSSQPFIPVAESFCHAFYRVLGLPVIHLNKTDFYNPGYYGSEDSSGNKQRRQKIDNSANSPDILAVEIYRERSCNDNNLAFKNASSKLEYRLEMMRAPIPINMLDPNPNIDPFSFDKNQINTNFPNRNKFKTVSKILRPFKCVSYIVNNVEPRTNQICAPFIMDNDATILGTKLSHPYLEFVARIRFKSDIQKFGKSDLYNSIAKQLETLTDASGKSLLSDFSLAISQFSDVEAYIFLQLFISFVSICLKVKETRIKNQQLATEIYNKIYNTGTTVSVDKSGKIQLSLIDLQLDEKKKQKLQREIILAQLPVSTQFVDNIRLTNPIDCITNNTFISLVQGDLNDIETQIKELEQQKNNQLALFNSINDNSFFVLGEVNGIGLLDIMCLLMSFWLLPQNELLSMFDAPSFNRLYRENNLHCSVVENRKSTKDKSNVPISDVIKSMDKIVFNLLKIASDIVASNNKTS